MSLPKGYKRLEYIQSSGTQYVDTLFAPNQDTRVVADVQMMSEVSSGGANEIFGARTSASSKAYAVQWNTTGDMFQHFYNAGYDNLDFGNFSERQIVETNKNVLLINGVTHERPYAAFQCDYTLYLCAVNQENAAKFFSAMRVYVCQIYDNGTLVRDFIPCQNADSEIGLWDDVNSVFYGNAGTGAFTAGHVVPEMVDESEITELEYIQSSGTQYFKTGFLPTNESRVVMDFEATADPSGNIGLCGSRTTSTSKAFCFWFYTDYIQSCRFDFGTNNPLVNVKLPTNEKLSLDMNQNICVCGDFSETQTDTSFQGEYDLVLFGINTAGTVGSLFTGKLYACQAYELGLLERDFVPAMLSNGEVGLYDKVYHEFYRNAGTGEFTAGPEMVHEDYTGLEYIESSGNQFVDTLFVPNQDTRVVMDVLFTNEKEGVLFGSRTSSAANNFSFLNTAALQYRADYNTTRAALSASKSSRFSLDMNKNVLSFDGETIHTFTYASFQGTYPLHLFVLNSAGSNAAYATATLYSCQIYDNGTEIRSYIPMLHPSGVVGLWDSVNERFYASATTTDFLAGPEAATVPKAPANFRVESETDTLITLAWDASDEVLGYRLYRQGQLLADTTETFVSVTVEPFAGAVFTLAAYNENGEGEGATLTHYSIPENPLLYLITDRTQQDVAERNQKGYYAASDLNRVGYAVEYLAKRLKESGVTVTVAPVLTWTDMDWGTPTAMRAYLADVQTMRGALKLAESTPTVPDDMEKLTYTEANQIEMILLALDTHIKNMLMTLDAGWAMGLAYTGLYAKEAYR